jgi:hypothetical protein
LKIIDEKGVLVHLALEGEVGCRGESKFNDMDDYLLLKGGKFCRREDSIVCGG